MRASNRVDNPAIHKQGMQINKMKKYRNRFDDNSIISFVIPRCPKSVFLVSVFAFINRLNVDRLAFTQDIHLLL